MYKIFLNGTREEDNLALEIKQKSYVIKCSKYT